MGYSFINVWLELLPSIEVHPPVTCRVIDSFLVIGAQLGILHPSLEQ